MLTLRRITVREPIRFPNDIPKTQFQIDGEDPCSFEIDETMRIIWIHKGEQEEGVPFEGIKSVQRIRPTFETKRK